MTAAEERRQELERRLGLSKAHGFIVRIVFFVLTSLGVIALFFGCEELHLPKGWIAAILSIALAEFLIRRLHVRGTGVESALWLGGLFAWIFGLPSEGKPEGLLVFAAASAIAGRRLRNPLFGGLAAVFVISYLGAKNWYAEALIAGIVIAAAALAARLREWQRPSTEWLFVALLFVCPIAGAAWTFRYTSFFWAFAYLALAVAELTFAERKRDHAALAASAVSIVIAAVVLRDVFAFALEWKLIASGALMFAVALAVSRVLRGRTRGFVMTPVKSAYEEALRIFGTAAFAPQTKVAATPQTAGGGNFGGAGATGDF
jgi:hypothetical protein